MQDEADADDETITLVVTINGTDENPWHAWGLTANPFPQVPKAELMAGQIALASLDGDPVKSPEDIRERLEGFAPEFIEGCIARWRPGERTRFQVTFPRRRDS